MQNGIRKMGSRHERMEQKEGNEEKGDEGWKAGEMSGRRDVK